MRIGISGWTYAAWRDVFYSLQRPSSYQRWHDETPPGFVFALKGPRFITHMKRLLDARTALANFFASGPLALGAKLGPIRWQLTPTLAFDDRVEAFLSQLPRTSAAAAELACEHDARLDDRALTLAERDQPLRHALEVRHPSFAGPELDDVTSDIVYLRLHGVEELYASGYDEPELSAWAQRISLWRNGLTPHEGRTVAPDAPVRARDVFVYFDNDMKVRAPADAMALARLVAHWPPTDQVGAHTAGRDP